MRNVKTRYRLDARVPLCDFPDAEHLAEKKRRIEIYKKRGSAGIDLFEDKNGEKTY